MLVRCLLLTLLGAAACAPAIAEQVARGDWYDACRRRMDHDAQAEFQRAMLRELATGVILDAEILDARALTRELGVPVEGDLLQRVQLVRFTGTLSSPRLTDARVVLVSVGDGRRGFATTRKAHAISGREEADLYADTFGQTLSEIGIAELLLAPTGEPGSPDALKPRPLLDPLPVPLGGGTDVGTLRERLHERSLQEASWDRRKWRKARAAAMRSDPALAPAAARLAERLDSGEWLLLRPSRNLADDAMEVAIDGMITGEHGEQCPVSMTVSIALPGPSSLAARVEALFHGSPRPLTELPWQLEVWRGF